MPIENTFIDNFNAKNIGTGINNTAKALTSPVAVAVAGATSYSVYATARHNKFMQKLETQRNILIVQTAVNQGYLPPQQGEAHIKFLDYKPSCIYPDTPDLIPLKNVSFGTSTRSSRFGSIMVSYEQKNYSGSKKPQEVYRLVEATPSVLSPREERQVIVESAIHVLCMFAGVFAVLTIYNIFFPQKQTTPNFTEIDEKQAEKRESDLLKKNISEILVKLTTIESETESIKNQTQKLSAEIALLKQEYRK